MRYRGRYILHTSSQPHDVNQGPSTMADGDQSNLLARLEQNYTVREGGGTRESDVYSGVKFKP